MKKSKAKREEYVRASKNKDSKRDQSYREEKN